MEARSTTKNAAIAFLIFVRRTTPRACRFPPRIGLVFVVCLVRSRAPGNETGPEVRKWKDCLKTTPIGMDLVKTEEAMIGESKSYPAPVGRIGTDDGADISTFIVRYEMKLRSVWTDGDDVF